MERRAERGNVLNGAPFILAVSMTIAAQFVVPSGVPLSLCFPYWPRTGMLALRSVTRCH